MKIVLLLAILHFIFLVEKAQAACARTTARTECIQASIGETPEPLPNFSVHNQTKVINLPNVCRRIIYTPETKLEVDITLESSQSCPNSGALVFGDLHLPCNDNGPKRFASFRLSNKAYCHAYHAAREAGQLEFTILKTKPILNKNRSDEIKMILGSRREFSILATNCLWQIFEAKTLDPKDKYRLTAKLHFEKDGDRRLSLEKIDMISSSTNLSSEAKSCFAHRKEILDFRFEDPPEELLVDVAIKFGGSSDHPIGQVAPYLLEYRHNKNCEVEGRPYHWNVALCKYAGKSSDFFAKGVQSCLFNQKIRFNDGDDCAQNKKWKSLLCEYLKNKLKSEYKNICIDNKLPPSVEQKGLQG